jgi:hypothetical protein
MVARAPKAKSKRQRTARKAGVVPIETARAPAYVQRVREIERTRKEIAVLLGALDPTHRAITLLHHLHALRGAALPPRWARLVRIAAAASESDERLGRVCLDELSAAADRILDDRQREHRALVDEEERLTENVEACLRTEPNATDERVAQIACAQIGTFRASTDGPVSLAPTIQRRASLAGTWPKDLQKVVLAVVTSARESTPYDRLTADTERARFIAARIIARVGADAARNVRRRKVPTKEK